MLKEKLLIVILICRIILKFQERCGGSRDIINSDNFFIIRCLMVFDNCTSDNELAREFWDFKYVPTLHYTNMEFD